MEEPNEGEDRILVKSPKVATYDLKPEMSAYEVCDKLVDAIKSETYDAVSYTHLFRSKDWKSQSLIFMRMKKRKRKKNIK